MSSDDKRKWVADYLANLPPELRTSATDPKLLDAARIAYTTGWDATEIAAAVAARNYDGANYPSLIACQRLAEIGANVPGGKGRPTLRPDEWTQAHCGRPGCPCAHTEGCSYGWLDHVPGEHGYDFTMPCHICRPSLAQRLREIPGPGRRTIADAEYIKTGRGKDDRR